MIKNLFLDIDDTIFDFKSSEALAIKEVMSSRGVLPTDENVSLYSKINLSYWKRLEKGELKREEILTLRFSDFFSRLGISVSGDEVQRQYADTLSRSCIFLDGAREAVSLLKKEGYRLFALTNGTADVQRGRIAISGIEGLFEKIFISELIGYDKPSRNFFEYCLKEAGIGNRKTVLMVGDSPTSDIAGGKGAGLLTCYVNTRGVNDSTADYEIRSISELSELLERINKEVK